MDRKCKMLSNIKDKKIALWGLSFKPGTDDIREAPSRNIVESLVAAGAQVTVYDPVAMEAFQSKYGDSVIFAKNAYDCVLDADCLVVATEWQEFRFPNFQLIKNLMNEPVIFDGRNIFNKVEMEKQGFNYLGIGLQNEGFDQWLNSKAS